MTILLKRFAIQKLLLTVLPQKDIVDGALSTKSAKCFINVNRGETMSSKRHKFSLSKLPVMWCKSVHLMLSWVQNQRHLIGIETQYLLITVIIWLTCHHHQTIDYVIVQTLNSFHGKFLFPNGWSIWSPCTINTPTHSVLQAFSTFFAKINIFFQSCLKHFNSFLYESIVDLLERPANQKKTSSDKTSEQNLIVILEKKATWRQRTDLLQAKKVLQLLKVITPPVINQLSWQGADFRRSRFCVQQMFEHPISYQAKISKVSSFTNSHVPCWLT